ncbi:hypothetical protein Mal15_18080 [Stieleria maiorica]|uniref:Uncharacterized protein n=1 Tax=Stieleria maiorica TaxID=2795974 RepID=A0A5B9MDT6_9BACT|nr:hypothetical protein Mal15_18080 [Stieleria maiorica]
MHGDSWSLDNQWLNEFSDAFDCGTHRLIREISIDAQPDCVVLEGWARNFYAVQLAIHTTQIFSRSRPRFPQITLLLRVDGPMMEFNIAHRGESRKDATVSTPPNACRHELTLAPV